MSDLNRSITETNELLAAFIFDLPDHSRIIKPLDKAIHDISNSSHKFMQLSNRIHPDEQKFINQTIANIQTGIHNNQEEKVLHNANQLASYLSSKIQGRN